MRQLDLRGNREITSAPFIEAKRPAIERLDLDETSFGDAGFRAVLQWPYLTSLSVLRTQVSDEAFAGIPDQDRSRLRTLNLSGTSITSDALPELGKFVSLDYLLLSETRITDDNLECLNDLPALNMLILNDCQISDVGLQKLQSSTLRTLWLERTQVTPAGFANLTTNLPAIDSVWLKGCNISEVAAAKLIAQYPDVQFIDAPGGQLHTSDRE